MQLCKSRSKKCNTSRKQIDAELDWLFYLKSKNIHFAQPLPSAAGNWVETIADARLSFFVTVFKATKGKALSHQEDFTRERMHNWGHFIGSLHTATKDYLPKSAIEQRPAWHQEKLFLAVKRQCGPSHPLKCHFKQLQTWLGDQVYDADCFGLIHADIHHGNFLVDNNDRITVFDFDDCHYHWYAYDLAVAIFNLFLSLRKTCTKQHQSDLRKWLLEGYSATGSLTHVGLKSIDFFILYRHFVIYFWAKKNIQSDQLNNDARAWMDMAITYCHNAITTCKLLN